MPDNSQKKKQKSQKRAQKYVKNFPKKNSNTQIALKAKDEHFLDNLLDDMEKNDGKQMPLLLILDQIQDPRNLGACMRSANGAGAHAVIAPKHKSVKLTAAAVATARGAADETPFVVIGNLANLLTKLKKRQIFILCADDKCEKSLYDLDLNLPLAIVLGSEGFGARRLTIEKSDFHAHIPMAGKVSCLNVASASAVLLYEVLRQRAAIT